MSHSKIIKLKEETEIELKMKSKLFGNDEILDLIKWNSKLNKFYLIFNTELNPFRVLEPETEKITIPIQLDLEIRNIEPTEKENHLVLLDEEWNLTIIEIENYKICKKLKLPTTDVESFVFSSKFCNNVYVNSNSKGLYKVDLNSKKTEKMNFTGFYCLNKNNFLASSNYKVLYGSSKNDPDLFPASYNLARGFKFKIYSQKFQKFHNESNTLSRQDMIFISGDKDSKLTVTDLRSDKCLCYVQFERKKWIVCLESKGKLVYGGVEWGELFIMRNSYPFEVIYCKEINECIFSIALSEHYFVVGGSDYKDQVKIFEIPEIKEKNLKTKS